MRIFRAFCLTCLCEAALKGLEFEEEINTHRCILRSDRSDYISDGRSPQSTQMG